MEKLDIGCGPKCAEGYVGIDNKNYDKVDFVHDIETFPWPFEDEKFIAARMCHVLEHIKPWLFFDLLDEIWRVLKPDGEIEIRVPVGLSYRLDPTHCNELCVPSFWYLDHEKDFYKIYKPKPWSIIDTSVKDNEEIRLILKKVKKTS